MDIFTRKRLDVWLILLLVVLNIGAISILLFALDKRRSTPGDLPDNMKTQRTLELLQQELGFTDTQIREYDRLRRIHARQTQPLIRNIRRIKKQMMDEIFTGHPDSTAIRQAAEQISLLQADVEQLTFKHFLDLKALCGDKQADQLHRLVGAFLQNNRPPQKLPGEQRPMPDRPMRPPGSDE